MIHSEKNQKSGQKKTNALKIAVAAIPVLLIAIIAAVVLNNNSPSTSTQAGVVKDSDLTIQLDEISEKAKFYPVEIDGTRLEVLAVKAPDGTVRTAFNTCQVCYSSGRGYYKQEGDELVCQNCGNRFGMGDVEVTRGGCNPVPITSEYKTVDDTSITISKEFLSEAKVIFSNWKN